MQLQSAADWPPRGHKCICFGLQFSGNLLSVHCLPPKGSLLCQERGSISTGQEPLRNFWIRNRDSELLISFTRLTKMTEIGSQTSSRAVVLCAEIRQVVRNQFSRSRSSRINQNKPKRVPEILKESGLKSRASALTGDLLKGAGPV